MIWKTLFIGVVAGMLAGCGPKALPRIDTYPVTGQVFVDGSPAGDLAVYFTSEQEMSSEFPTVSTAQTDADGKFSVSTYETGDGMPEGTYAATFLWGQLNLMSMTYGGPDKLNDRYTDPAKSQFKITVKRGEPADMGKIMLTTK